MTEHGELGIELEENDSYILELLNSDLGNVHQINHREREKEFNNYKFTSKTSILRVYSKKIVEDLFSNGIVFRKTYDKEFPRVEKKYFFHFLRGFMDGDGCISNNVLSFTGANRDFFEYLRNFILEEFSFKSGIYKEKENKYRLIFNKSETKKILPRIYHNCGSHCLQRKKALYLGSPPRKL